MAAVQTQPLPVSFKTSWQTLRGLLKKARRSRAKRNSTVVVIERKDDVQYDSGVEIVDSPPKVDLSEPQIYHKALVIAAKGQYELRHSHPIPHLDDHEVMIRSHCVGLNPIDWKSVDYNFCLPDFPWVRYLPISTTAVSLIS